MTRTLLRYEPDHAVPPGATLQEHLDDHGMTQAELARRTGLSAKHVNRLVKGKVALTPEVAVKLERVTDIPARMWNSLEAVYRDRLVRLNARSGSGDDVAWLETLPVAELTKRGHLPRTRDKAAQAEAALRFFKVASPDAWRQTWLSPAAAFRLSPTLKCNTGALASWVHITKIEAERIECSPFDAGTFRATLTEIRSSTADPPRPLDAWLRRLCAEAGVAMVFVPEIPGARASGAAYWMARDKAVIALSLRYKRDDHFWFSLFHEAGHILLHRQGPLFIETSDPQDRAGDDAEKEADRFAATSLIPESHEQRLDALREYADIQRFAAEIGIAPGIVVGRLQHDGHLPYDRHNALKKSVNFTEAL